MKSKIIVITISILTLLLVNCKKKDAPAQLTQAASPSPLASVLTTTISNITDSTAVSGGTVTSEGTSAITAVGICWDTLPSPTTLKNHTINGAGTGNYTSNMTGLKINKKYYVRAYATNGNGTAYGNEIGFLSPVYNSWIKSNSASTYTNFTCFLCNGASIYAGTSSGIVFSSDTGNTWVSKGLVGTGISNIVQKNNTLFAVGYGSFNNYTVYRSTDNGNSWVSLSANFPYPVAVYDVAVNNNTKLIAGTDSSAFYSLDDGNTWVRSKNGLPSPVPSWGGGGVYSLLSSGQQQVYAFASTFVGPGNKATLFKYDDANNNWISTLVLSQPTYITYNKFSGNNIFISYRHDDPYTYSSYYYIDMSKDGGVSWSTLTSNPTTISNVDVNGSIVFISNSTNNFALSMDNGENWVTVRSIGLPTTHGNAFVSQNYLWMNTSNGIYKYKYN